MMEHLPIPSFMTAALQRVINAKSSNEKPAPNPLTFPRAKSPWSSEVFRNPPSEYRGLPFWAWNTKLDKNQLLRQIDVFEEMGMGGFHMHSRTGLDTEYLGEEFMDMVRTCVDYAESKGLLACLYDEDRWPSGTAGGKVIKDNTDFKKKKVKFTPYFYDGDLLAAYIIELDENGCLKSSRMLKETEISNTEGNIWFAYVETDGPNTWYNGETYVDTLSKDAMAHFIELTHEKYKSKIGDKFGNIVPAIFTDEPQFTIMNNLSSPKVRGDVYFAWTSDLLESYRKEYASDLLPHFPELVWNLPDGKPSVSRVRYRDHTCERFVTAFMDQIAEWCTKNNIMLNGHMMEEPTLHSQTCALGEAMRCYRKMQMPGMDLLVDWTEYNTAKQVSSVARQNGLRGAMSELYGVTHWTFTFEGHKGCGDWQAALGITTRVHHLAWVSMAGEGKRDYPASINYQSPWYKEYGYIENHFARVGVALTRGKALTRIGVIHPIESYWLSFGPSGSGDEAEIRDRAFGDLTNWLLQGLIDFDFISESMLPSQIGRKAPKRKLAVGECEYDTVILPNLKTVRSTTLKILRDFSKAGGKVIVAGSAPSFVDASIPISNLAIEKSKNVLWSKQSILTSLEEHRDLRITPDGDISNDKFLYQMRQDGDDRFVFICNRDRSSPVPATVQLKGHWDIVKMDTLTGEAENLKVFVGENWTTFWSRFEGCASLLLRLTPSSASSIHALVRSPIPTLGEEPKAVSTIQLESVKLSEPNVLMLDYAEFKLDDGDWSPQEEVLRLDNIVRGRLGLFSKGGEIKQPWCFSPEEREPKARLTMRFTINSDFTVTDASMLALEDAEKMIIYVNDVAIATQALSDNSKHAWWIDEDIKTVSVPPYLIHKGTNTITLSFPFGALTNVERVYLLGNFSVALSGHDTLLKPAKANPVTWGNIVPQGLPFYVGNVIYKCSFVVPPSKKSSKSRVTLSIPHFSSPVLTVHDGKGKKLGTIALQPHSLDLGKLEEGKHEIEITAFGNRYNSFGHIHTPEWVGSCGPGTWRTGGDWWTDDYIVKPIGILGYPEIFIDAEETAEEAIEQRKDSGEWVRVRRNSF